MRTIPTFLLATHGLLLIGQAPAQLKPVDVDFQVRGYFYASSVDAPHLDGLGGWGGSANGPSTFTTVPGRTGLEINVDTTGVVALDSIHQGLVVTLRNHGPDTAFFPAQDSRLHMWAQALRGGDYADIEYLPSSWCGNSYHTLYLAPGEYWSFTMPKYKGKQLTRLRLVLEYQQVLDGERLPLYSHTFPGAVNRGQFSTKQGHVPQSIMDPYND